MNRRRSLSDDDMATPPRAEGEGRRWRPTMNTKIETIAPVAESQAAP